MLSYHLKSKNNAEDMSREIEKRLTRFGVCELGPGKFFVSGVKMPNGTSIFGMGSATKLILLPDVKEGSAITLGSFCTVKNLEIRGSEEKIELPSEVLERHGIIFEGNAEETKDYENQPRNSIIEGCFITAFTGGGITLRNTGYSPHSSITASNCHIWNSGAGIITKFSEYHEFSNILMTENLYGCINNGGNNVFTGCGFTSNKIGFVIDNLHARAQNHAHGSVIGCTFNHSDKNHGIGIALYGVKWGQVFSGCQLFYSKVIVEDSTNITFDSFNIGKGHSIEIKGGGLVTLSNSSFLYEPNIKVSENDKVKITNCFTGDGEQVSL